MTCSKQNFRLRDSFYVRSILQRRDDRAAPRRAVPQIRAAILASGGQTPVKICLQGTGKQGAAVNGALTGSHHLIVLRVRPLKRVRRALAHCSAAWQEGSGTRRRGGQRAGEHTPIERGQGGLPSTLRSARRSLQSPPPRSGGGLRWGSIRNWMLRACPLDPHLTSPTSWGRDNYPNPFPPQSSGIRIALRVFKYPRRPSPRLCRRGGRRRPFRRR